MLLALRRVALGRLVLGVLIGAALAASVQAAGVKQQVLHLTASDGHAVGALLTAPAEGMNTQAPAIVHIQGGPGATPLEGSGPWIAEGMAQKGYTIVAPLTRHGDRLLTYTFAQTDSDIRAAVDYLAASGFRRIILAGSSWGSITATRYVVDTQDPRILAVLHFAPTADAGPRHRKTMGEAEWQRTVSEAGALVEQGKGMNTVVPERFTHVASRWLDVWGPASQAVNSALFPQIRQPMLLMGGDADPINGPAEFERLKAAATASPKVDYIYYRGGVNHSFYPIHDKVIGDVTAWLTGIGLAPRSPVASRVLTLEDNRMGDNLRRAFLYSPAVAGRESPAFIVTQDWGGEVFEGVPQWLGEEVAQRGAPALGVGLDRGAGVLRNDFTRTDATIGAWIDEMARRGDKRIVLVGQGFGGLRMAHYLQSTHDARVIGLALVDPWPDSAALLRKAIGAPAYDAAMKQAAAEIAAGRGDTGLIQIAAPAPVPAMPDLDQRRLIQSPNAFLRTWGPQAPALSAILAATPVPVMFVGAERGPNGGQAALKALSGAVAAPTLHWYADTDANFAGAQSRLVDDLLAWSSALPGGRRR